MRTSNSVLLLLLAVGAIPVTAICAYAAYWAFIIRRTLAIRLYRNQALGIGLVGISIALTEVGVTAISYRIGEPNPGPLAEPFAIFAFMMIFFWIDASALTARRSDPLLRDTFHWTRLRIPLWALNIIAIAIDLYAVAYIAVYSPTTVPTPSTPLLFSILAPFFITGITGMVILPIVARRSKDMTFRRHVKWFGVFAAFLGFFLVAIVIIFSGSQRPTPLTQLGSQLLIDVGFVCGGYCLYRSARALVPINRISIEDRQS